MHCLAAEKRWCAIRKYEIMVEKKKENLQIVSLCFGHPFSCWESILSSLVIILRTVNTWKVSKYGVIPGPYFPVFGLYT